MLYPVIQSLLNVRYVIRISSSQWSVVCGQWSVVNDQWSMANGLFSVGYWSVVSGTRSVNGIWVSCRAYLPVTKFPVGSGQ